MPLLVSIDSYRSLFEKSLDAFFIARPEEGRLVEVNMAACLMFGYTREEMFGLHRDQVIDTSGLHFSMLLHERKEEGSVKGVITGIRKNGERFPMELSSVIVEDEKGEKFACTVATEVSDKALGPAADIIKGASVLHRKEEDSRALLENVLNSLTDGFFILNRNFTILFWNAAIEKILHRPAAEVIGRNIWDEFPEFIKLSQHDYFHHLVDDNRSIRFRDFFPEYHIWADVSVYPSEKYISVYVKDVTEVKNLRTLEKLERDVLEMNARPNSNIENTLDFYLRAIEGLHEGMYCSVMRIKGNMLYEWAGSSLPKPVRERLQKGIPVAENSGSCGTSAFRKEKVVVTDIENDPQWAETWPEAAESGIKASWSLPIIDSHNRVMGTFAIYYKTNKTPTPNEEYTLERVKNLLMIILENKLSVEAVRHSNQRYDMVALATNDAIWDWDTESDMVSRTGKGLKMLFGYDLEESQDDGNFWHKRIHPDDIGQVFEKQKRILENPAEMYWEDEYRFLKKSGIYAYVHDKGYIIRDDAGRAVRVLGATRDITERKESEALLLELNNRLKQRADELSASNVELERFAYIASHDMQEPLRMITSFLQLFKKKYEDQIDETAEQYIHFAVDGAERMKKLIQDLLQYSRVGSNKENFEEINTNALLDEVVNVFLAALEETGAIITVDALPDLKANRTQLFQLFQNLIGNAMKYHSGEPPVIQIEGKEEDNHYQFSVSDNGIGIKPVFFEKIFVLFQRLHHKHEYSGTGIGLAICKKIVDRHHGKIWVSSEPGKGSTFFFTIAKHLDGKLN
ncbi:PAS domain S-box protein [Sediminibacterium soli]|uniref:PAS domain S-box protein n=1 Tax=Sediminibacterium soli TaxID=2698829 RepID=UPI00137AFC0C|nr:PAS domain S-box protein [Sediminibacterium soli]NCI45178.1 PAS domain S-box protein [Sediminibacterium soli]